MSLKWTDAQAIAEEYTEDSIPSNEEMMKILSFLLFYISKMP